MQLWIRNEVGVKLSLKTDQIWQFFNKNAQFININSFSVLCIRIRIGSGFNGVPGSVSGAGIRIWIQQGKNYHKQDFGSGSGQWIRTVFGSRRAKMTHKSRKKLRNFMFWSAGCSLLRAEGFFSTRNLDVLYVGLETGKLYGSFLSEKNFVFCFGSGSGSVFSLKCWIRIRIKWIRIRNPAHKHLTKFINIIF